MKCPKCGKKMKQSTCAKCGYNLLAKYETPTIVETPAAPVQPTVTVQTTAPVATVTPTVPTYTPKVNYYTFNPANPNVWYPVSVTTQSQNNAPATTQVQVTTAPVQQYVQQPVQQPVQETAQPTAAVTESTEPKAETKVEDTEDLASAVGKRAERAAQKLMKRAEKKMSKVQKKRAKAALKMVDKIEEKVSKSTASRLFALLLIGVAVFMFGFLNVYSVTDIEKLSEGITSAISQGNMLNVLMDAFQAEEKLFGFLPAFFTSGYASTAYNLSVFIFSLCGVIAVLYAIFAVFSKTNAPKRVRRALFFLGAGALDYTVSLSALFGNGENSLLTDKMLQGLNLFELGGYQVEMLPAAIGAACVVLSFLFLIFRKRVKKQKEEETEATEA